MPAIKPSCIRDLKLRINLVDVISRTVAVRRAGARFKALCPFHQEKTPSFTIDPDRGFYKCFGCGKAGDIVSFVRETEQLSFTEAVEALGQRFGIPIEYEEGAGPTREERSLRQELFDLHAVAADHFRQTWLGPSSTGDFMRRYWTDERRFAPEVAEEFQIGAAAPSDDGLAAALLKRRFSEDALRQCGLFFIREDATVVLGTLRPRFRGRLMIPIRDHQGRIVAFTARQTTLTPEDDPAQAAKYVNSPETPIFTKSHLLFNLDRARAEVGENRPFVLVEGQLDAIRCWSVGLRTAVAPQGTSITESQLTLLRRYAQKVECFFDSDSAGQKAALRFLPMALKAGFEARFLVLSDNTKLDPDVLFCEQGIAAYETVRRRSLSAMSFACKSILPGAERATPEEKARSMQTLCEIVSAAESEVARAGFLNEIAAYLTLPIAVVQRDFSSFLRRQSRAMQPPASREEEAETPTLVPVNVNKAPEQSPEYHLLLLILHYESIGKPITQVLPYEWIDTSHLAGRLLRRFLLEMEHDDWPGRDHLEPILEDDEEKSLIASLLFDSPDVDDPLKVAEEGLRMLRARNVEPRMRKIELDLANLRADSSVDAISLVKELTELQRLLRQPIRIAGTV